MKKQTKREAEKASWIAQARMEEKITGAKPATDAELEAAYEEIRTGRVYVRGRRPVIVAVAVGDPKLVPWEAHEAAMREALCDAGKVGMHRNKDVLAEAEKVAAIVNSLEPIIGVMVLEIAAEKYALKWAREAGYNVDAVAHALGHVLHDILETGRLEEEEAARTGKPAPKADQPDNQRRAGDSLH